MPKGILKKGTTKTPFFSIQRLFQSSYYNCYEIGPNQRLNQRLAEAFCDNGRSCVKSDKLYRVVSLDSAIAGTEDYKFERDFLNVFILIWGLRFSLVFSSLLDASSLRLHQPPQALQISKFNISGCAVFIQIPFFGLFVFLNCPLTIFLFIGA